MCFIIGTSLRSNATTIFPHYDHNEEEYEYSQQGSDGRPLKIQWQKPHETNEIDTWRNTLGRNFESALKYRDNKKYRSLPPPTKKPVDPRRFGMVDPFKYASYIDDEGWNPIVYFAQELQKEEEIKRQKSGHSNSTNEAEELVNMIVKGNLSRSGRESKRRDSGVSHVDSNRKGSISSTSTVTSTKPPIPKKSSNRIQDKRDSKNCPTCKGMVAEGGYYTQWCQPCENRKFEDLFEHWSSGNDVIDCFILESQLNAKSRFDYLEWIPFDRFKDVQLIGLGGFGSVYHAIWLDGPREKLDKKTGQYVRCGEWRIALKCFDNSEHITPDFFEEQFSEAERRRLASINEGIGTSNTPDQLESPIHTPIQSPISSGFNIDKNEHFEESYTSRFLRFESLQEPTIIFTRTNDPREHLAVQKYMAEETRSYNIKYEMMQIESSEIVSEVYEILQYW
ncbi:13576_t:CDS:2 [Funneliformis mosseae]|uniref:13576_t:CDS:1 n=1 Tax=Funneliformis mosseae TaxID=27381 RepID=A0A9N8YP33_FUNMO|nr:13576_t:CDS:2 [Funneliformis mosseae]